MDAEAELEGFIAKYSDPVAAQIRTARSKMRALLPGSLELVYDNYNALAIAYGPTEKQADYIFSIAAYPRWVSLFLVGGPHLDDPKKLLKGEGGVVRHIVLDPAERLDDPDVRDLMDQALARAPVPLDPGRPSRVVIKSISAKQRPRRP
jgi:hypothetical protein